MDYLLTTDPGLEDVAASELQERIPAATTRIRPYGTPGHVRITAGEIADIEPELLRLTMIHQVIEIRGETEAHSLDQVVEAVGQAEFPDLESAASFRVTTRCEGDHEFGRQEIQRAAGGVLVRRYGTPVNLEDFELQVRVDLYGDRMVAGVQRTGDSLGNRIRRARALRSALRPTVAAAMIRLAGAHRGAGVLADPMCGAGTIPIEAARANPGLELFAADWDEATVEVARETIVGHGLEIPVHTADARALGKTHPESFDFIVTDPPYGLRQARRTSISRLYRGLLNSFDKALKPDGTVVLVVVKYRAFLAALEGTGLQIRHEREVDLGGIRPKIYLLGQA